MMQKKSKIRIKEDNLVYDGQFIKTIQRHFIDKDGKPQVWEMVKRNTYGRIVVVAPITPEKELILEKIYRMPLKCYTLELPAGLMDKPNETEIEAIRRELLEETGYVAERFEFLVAGPYNTGLTADELAIYAGVNARKVQEPQLEASEDIEIIKVPIGKLLNFLETAEKKVGAKPDIKITAVIPYLQNKGLI